MRRVFLVVIDALGVGALPDAPDYGDALHCSTLGGIDAQADSLHLPTLAQWGLGHLLPLKRIPAVAQPTGSYGRLAEQSKGKDTTTGHWEMMGVILETPFPTYPNGFPSDIIQAFCDRAGVPGILGNVPASGTAILDQLGPQHLETGWPIVYTSADSVFQIAAHVEKVPLATLYQWCQVARDLLRQDHEVSRVIARPFIGEPGQFQRLGGDRRDYAVHPPADTVLTRLQQAGCLVMGVGKIEDIFCSKGLTHAIHTAGNTHGLQVLTDFVDGRVPWNQLSLEAKPVCDYDQPEKQLIFVNLVDTDMNYGHRRDVNGYARALEEIDTALAKLALKPDDLLLITGDHGCDPTAPGSDHTREFVPILMVSPNQPGVALGDRTTFADVGQTVLDWLGENGQGLPGSSLLHAAKPVVG
jgi:phosphopentomutase